MPAPAEMTPTQLMRLVGTPDAPAIVDARTDGDFDDDPHLVPGAFRHPWDDAQGLAARLAGARPGGTRAVVYCQRGRKLSQGLAALLRSGGIAAEVLEGGQFAWRDAGLPAVRAAALPASGRWATRHRPKVDRIACPWLVRRFADTSARFLFVPPADVALVAERFDAVPFDAEGAALSDGPGRCTFDALLDHLGLDHPPLARMASVIRAADGAGGEAPEAAGLLAVLLGLSRMHRDDLRQLEDGMIVMDALYRWARDATAETHGHA